MGAPWRFQGPLIAMPAGFIFDMMALVQSIRTGVDRAVCFSCCTWQYVRRRNPAFISYNVKNCSTKLTNNSLFQDDQSCFCITDRKVQGWKCRVLRSILSYTCYTCYTKSGEMPHEKTSTPEEIRRALKGLGLSAVPAETDLGLEKEQCTVQPVQLQVVRVCCGSSHLTPLPGGSKDTLQSSEAGWSEHLRTVDKRPTGTVQFNFRYRIFELFEFIAVNPLTLQSYLMKC